MCGIIGYLGRRRAAPILIEALKNLEYRGYDSAGVAVQEDGEVRVVKRVGRISSIEEEALRLPGTMGIGHTRWATHGEPADRNAHPLWDCRGMFYVVHNGTLENADELVEELRGRGHRFSSETDTEVIAHLIEENFDGDPLRAVLATVRRLRGSFAFVLMVRGWRGLIGVRKDSPLVLGVGEGEYFLSSDLAGFIGETRRAVFLDNGWIVEVRDSGYRILDFTGSPVKAEVGEVEVEVSSPDMAGHPHFMHKEIYEQPEAIRRTLEGLAGARAPDPGNVVFLVASGTSYHASLIASYILRRELGIMAVAEISSEFAYSRIPEVDGIAIITTQSGETADAIKAARAARRAGLRTFAITNTPGSSITREVDSHVLTRAGIEVSVAATKTFTAQLAAFLWLASSWGADLSEDAAEAPRRAYSALLREDKLRKLAPTLANAGKLLYLGRGLFRGMAMEGALKMKEITYRGAEAFPSGEMKHGPLALVDGDTWIVSLVPEDGLREKNFISCAEARARGGRVLAVTPFRDGPFDEVVEVGGGSPYGQLFESAVILQLLAYHAAVSLGRDVDRPRNLAKSVTVE